MTKKSAGYFLVIILLPLHILFKEVDKMRENKKRQQILNVLAKSIRAIIENEELDFEN